MKLAKLHLLAPALLGLVLAGFGAPVLADDDDDDRGKHGWYDDGHRGHGWRHDRRDWDDRDYRHGYRHGRRDERRWDRYDDRRDWHRDRRGRVIYREVYRAPAYGYGPGYGYAPPPRHYGPPRWARGHRIHDYGWAPTYVVVDYDRYGLRHPPRGYHWRRDDRGDWLLVAVATGIIADVILNR
ncbi:MAG: RcnB family protein [Silanimonas sp.]